MTPLLENIQTLHPVHWGPCDKENRAILTSNSFFGIWNVSHTSHHTIHTGHILKCVIEITMNYKAQTHCTLSTCEFCMQTRYSTYEIVI